MILMVMVFILKDMIVLEMLFQYKMLYANHIVNNAVQKIYVKHVQMVINLIQINKIVYQFVHLIVTHALDN